MSAELFTFLLGLFGITPGDGNVHLCTSPNYHTAVTTFAGNSLHMRHTVVCMDKWDAGGDAAAHRALQVHAHAHGADAVHPHAAAPRRRASSKYDVSSMKWAIHAAAPCPVDVKRKMLDWWGPVIWEYYAATEGGGTIAPPDEWLKYPGTVGRAWPIARAEDHRRRRQRACRRGEPGTVWMSMGAGDFEYKGDKEKTTKSHDAEGYFTVGDIGYLNDDGYLFLCDRKTDMIIAGGVNIYPAEIEGAIHEHPQVADVAVFGIPDDDMGEQIKAVVEPLAGRRRRRRVARVDHGARPAAAREVQVAAQHRLRRRAAARAHRQAVEAQAARPRTGKAATARSDRLRLSSRSPRTGADQEYA